MTHRAAGLPERRHHPRVPFQSDIEIEWGSTAVRAMTSDLSIGGMFINLMDPLWVGATFSAEVRLDQPLRVDCVVRRVVPGTGIGVEFQRVTQSIRERLDVLVASILNP